MADTKYTPGPWKATARRVSKPETEDRLALDVQINGGNRDDNKANARLIAAAPYMLEALEKIEHQLDLRMTHQADNPAYKVWSELWDIACDAIEKATGNAPT